MPHASRSPRFPAFLTALYLAVWLAAIFLTDAMAWDALRGRLADFGAAGMFLIGLGWSVWLVERASQRIRAGRILALGGSGLWEGSLGEMRRDRPTRRTRIARGPR